MGTKFDSSVVPSSLSICVVYALKCNYRHTKCTNTHALLYLIASNEQATCGQFSMPTKIHYEICAQLISITGEANTLSLIAIK